VTFDAANAEQVIPILAVRGGRSNRNPGPSCVASNGTGVTRATEDGFSRASHNYQKREVFPAMWEQG
jgi:hypothetical protein